MTSCGRLHPLASHALSLAWLASRLFQLWTLQDTELWLMGRILEKTH